MGIFFWFTRIYFIFFNKSWWLIDRTFIILTQTTFWPLCPSELLLSGFSLLCFDRYFPQFFPLVTSCCNASQMTILFESFRLWMEKSLRMMFSKMVRHSTYQGLDKKSVVLLSFKLWWPDSVLFTSDLVSKMSLLFSIQPQLKFDCLTIFDELYYILIICCKKVLCAQYQGSRDTRILWFHNSWSPLISDYLRTLILK